MTSGKITQFDDRRLRGLYCAAVSIGIEGGLELSFIDFEPHLGEAMTITFDDWRDLSVNGLGTVSSSSCMPVNPGETEHRLKLQFGDGDSLEVLVRGCFEVQTSAARAY